MIFWWCRMYDVLVLSMRTPCIWCFLPILYLFICDWSLYLLYYLFVVAYFNFKCCRFWFIFNLFSVHEVLHTLALTLTNKRHLLIISRNSVILWAHNLTEFRQILRCNVQYLAQLIFSRNSAKKWVFCVTSQKIIIWKLANLHEFRS